VLSLWAQASGLPPGHNISILRAEVSVADNKQNPSDARIFWLRQIAVNIDQSISAAANRAQPRSGPALKERRATRRADNRQTTREYKRNVGASTALASYAPTGGMATAFSGKKSQSQDITCSLHTGHCSRSQSGSWSCPRAALQHGHRPLPAT
jgi:hypothetical protein